MIRVGSLFTGIGGLDLGFGVAPVWACERDPYARRVLAARHPGAPCYDDITTLSHPPAVDVLTGGFPCQNLSNAGNREGLAGAKSGLWFHMLRLVDELRPKVMVAENVAALQNRGLDVVVGGLEALGYRVEATRIAASDVGAPHRRMRLLILAYRQDVPMPWSVDADGGVWSRLRPRMLVVPRWKEGEPDALWTTPCAGDTGRSSSYAQGGTTASAQVREWPTVTHEGNRNRVGASHHSGLRGPATAVGQWPTLLATDAESVKSHGAGGSPSIGASVRDWVNVGPLNPEWCEALMGFPRGWADPDATPQAFPGWPMGRGPEQYPWEPPRMVAPRTVAHRAHRIRCLGNAVVPAVGAVAAARVLSVL
jgi:site-specific DNA-cytosine methylase